MTIFVKCDNEHPITGYPKTIHQIPKLRRIPYRQLTRMCLFSKYSYRNEQERGVNIASTPQIQKFSSDNNKNTTSVGLIQCYFTVTFKNHGKIQLNSKSLLGMSSPWTPCHSPTDKN